MCVFCDGFRNRVRGYEELDCKRIGDEEVYLGMEKRYEEVFLLTRIGDRIIAQTPVSYCPMCGEKIGGEKR